jgi:hypothetical protein
VGALFSTPCSIELEVSLSRRTKVVGDKRGINVSRVLLLFSLGEKNQRRKIRHQQKNSIEMLSLAKVQKKQEKFPQRIPPPSKVGIDAELI